MESKSTQFKESIGDISIKLSQFLTYLWTIVEIVEQRKQVKLRSDWNSQRGNSVSNSFGNTAL